MDALLTPASGPGSHSASSAAAALTGLPEVVRHHGNAGVNRQHGSDTGHAARHGGVMATQDGPQLWRSPDHRDLQAGQRVSIP